MTWTDQTYDPLENTHNRPNWIGKCLYRDNPRFESPQQFGWFITVVLDHWSEGGPGVHSSWGLVAEAARYGTQIQTSTHPSCFEGPQDVYHLRWIRETLEAVAVDLTKRTKDGNMKSDGREWVQTWAMIDVFGMNFRDVASRLGLASTSTVSGRVRSAREAIGRELNRRGLIWR